MSTAGYFLLLRGWRPDMYQFEISELSLTAGLQFWTPIFGAGSPIF